MRGGWVDATLSRVLDAVISMPSLLFGLVVAALGSSIPVLIGTAAVIYTPGAYRMARSLAVNINALDFVKVARARGERTVLHHARGDPAQHGAAGAHRFRPALRLRRAVAERPELPRALASSRRMPTGVRWCARTSRGWPTAAPAVLMPARRSPR